MSAFQAWFIPAVAAQLDASGRLPGTRPEPGDSEVSAERAGELADMFLWQFGPLAQAIFSRDAGRAVVPSELRRCRRIDFVDSPYATIPPDASDNFKAMHGPQWLIRYCARDGSLSVEVYVTALGLGMSIDATGSFRTNVPLGNFFFRAVRPDGLYAEQSEDAASAGFATLPDPIAAVPRAVLIGRGWAPQVMSWAITQTDASGARTTRVALPVGFPRRWLISRRDSMLVEEDTLAEPDMQPTVLRILRRRSSAVTRAEILSLFGK